MEEKWVSKVEQWAGGENTKERETPNFTFLIPLCLVC